jgi:predicted signal transduction protein with EAL and GGDEF domain
VAGDDPENIRRNADRPLYHTKETDRGGFVCHSSRLATAITRREAAIREVPEAFWSDSVDAFYQPIFRLDTGKIVGVEALSRLIWSNGEVVAVVSFREAASDDRIASQLTRKMLNIVAASRALIPATSTLKGVVRRSRFDAGPVWCKFPLGRYHTLL